MKNAILDNEQIPNDQSIQMVTGSIFLGYGVLVAYKLGLYQKLSIQPMTLEEISSQLGLEERAALALLSASASFNLVELQNNMHYSLTQVGSYYLTKSSPAYYGHVFDLYLSQINDISFSKIEEAAKTNAPPVYSNTDLFDKHKEKKEGEAFTKSMHAKSYAPSQVWPKLLELSSSDRLIDIGGGSGVHTISACKMFPIKAVICDLEEVLAFARKNVFKEKLEDQISFQPLDMWKDPFPVGTIHFFSDIFHDWQAEDNQILAQKSFDALLPKGKIVINEMLFDASELGPEYTSAYNVKMLFWTKGKQYTAKEVTSILEAVGFIKTQVIPYFGCWSLVIGEKPS